MALRSDQVEDLAAALSPAEARVLRHLWERRHADIKELARVAGLPSHMEVLTLLREGINGAAERLFGRPVLVFEERCLDRASGQTVCFEWWLRRADDPDDARPERERAVAVGVSHGVAGSAAGPSPDVAGVGFAAAPATDGGPDLAEPSLEPFVEIHDEGETLVVVIVGAGVGAQTVEAARVLRGDSLIVVLGAERGRRELTISLPCAVCAEPIKGGSSNGVANITLVKRTNTEGDDYAG